MEGHESHTNNFCFGVVWKSDKTWVISHDKKEYNCHHLIIASALSASMHANNKDMGPSSRSQIAAFLHFFSTAAKAIKQL